MQRAVVKIYLLPHETILVFVCKKLSFLEWVTLLNGLLNDVTNASLLAHLECLQVKNELTLKYKLKIKVKNEAPAHRGRIVVAGAERRASAEVHGRR